MKNKNNRMDAMKTDALYYQNSHMEKFSAQVTGCEQAGKYWEVTLSATAFYPEGGGQAGDTGFLGGIRVLDTRERGETVIHLCDGPLEVGTEVEGTIDYAQRFDRMQQHSGEHIVSGIIHRRYGYHNTGFHMGSDLVTIDFDGVIPSEDLPSLEAEANRAVWENLPIRCWIPEPEELKTVTYRTKRALPWPVRIVEVPGYDSCACCGVHVKATGEIGLIKLISVMGFLGGTRMEMVCGRWALELLCAVFDQNRQVSQAFSAKILETGEAARRMNDQLAKQKYRLVGLEKQMFASIAAGYAGKGDTVHIEEGLDNTAVRELADAIAEHCGGIAAVFSGSDGEGYAFCMATRDGDLRQLCKTMTQTLNGRGGGKSNFQQGRVQGSKEQILSFFEKKA